MTPYQSIHTFMSTLYLEISTRLMQMLGKLWEIQTKAGSSNCFKVYRLLIEDWTILPQSRLCFIKKFWGNWILAFYHMGALFKFDFIKVILSWSREWRILIYAVFFKWLSQLKESHRNFKNSWKEEERTWNNTISFSEISASKCTKWFNPNEFLMNWGVSVGPTRNIALSYPLVL